MTTILFLYGQYNGYYLCQAEDSKKVEDTICYWLGKSPGIHRDDLEHIFVVEEEQLKDYIHVLEKIRKEEFDYEKKVQEQREREEFERLKKKFTVKSSQPPPQSATSDPQT